MKQTHTTLIVQGGPIDGSYEIDLSIPEHEIPANASEGWFLHSLLKTEPVGSYVKMMSPHAIERRQVGEVARHCHKYTLVSKTADAFGHETFTVQHMGIIPAPPKE